MSLDKLSIAKIRLTVATTASKTWSPSLDGPEVDDGQMKVRERIVGRRDEGKSERFRGQLRREERW